MQKDCLKNQIKTIGTGIHLFRCSTATYTKKIISNENIGHALFLLGFFPTYIFFPEKYRGISEIRVHKRDPRKCYSISYCRSLMSTLEKYIWSTPRRWGEATKKLFLFCVIFSCSYCNFGHSTTLLDNLSTLAQV